MSVAGDGLPCDLPGCDAGLPHVYECASCGDGHSPGRFAALVTHRPTAYAAGLMAIVEDRGDVDVDRILDAVEKEGHPR